MDTRTFYGINQVMQAKTIEKKPAFCNFDVISQVNMTCVNGDQT